MVLRSRRTLAPDDRSPTPRLRRGTQDRNPPCNGWKQRWGSTRELPPLVQASECVGWGLVEAGHIFQSAQPSDHAPPGHSNPQIAINGLGSLHLFASD